MASFRLCYRHPWSKIQRESYSLRILHVRVVLRVETSVDIKGLGIGIGESSGNVSFRAEKGQLKPIDLQAEKVHKEAKGAVLTPQKFLNRARDLIIHGPAHRGANGAAMPTDEGDQDGHFFSDHPERGGYPAA